jgi:hypothetical protein
MKQYIREKQVAEITSLKLPTLRNHRFLGKGIPYIKVGKTVLYDPDDVIAFMESHRVRMER